jgi:hypothetical protein
MRKIAILFTFLAFVGLANATVYLDETFNYSVSNLADETSWTTVLAGEGTVTGTGRNIIGTPLVYTNSGGTYILSNNGKTINSDFTSMTGTSPSYYAYKSIGSTISTTLYVSYLYKAGVAQGQSQSEVFGLASGTNQGPRLWVGKGTINTSHYRFGVTRSSTTSTDIKWGTTEYSDVNTVFLIVLKHDFSTGYTTLYINPVIGGGEPISGVATDNAGTARASLNNLWFRNTGSSAAKFNISGVRVSSTWAEAVAAQSTLTQLPPPSILSASSVAAESFTANWTAVANATGYDVKVYQGAGLFGTYSAGGQTTNSLFIKGLLTNTSYTYKVIAKGDGQNNTNSAESDPSDPFTTQEGLTAINTDFSDGSWGTLNTSTPTLGTFPSSYQNGYDLNKTILFQITKTDLRGESRLNGLRMDRQTDGGMVVLPTVKSLEQVEIHIAPGTADRNFSLKELVSDVWTTIGTYNMPSNDYNQYVISLSRATPTKLRIENAGSGQVTIYKIITRTTNPALLAAPATAEPVVTGSTGFTARWSTVPNATGYRVRLYSGETLVSTTLVENPLSESLQFNDLDAGSAYSYRVNALGDGFDEYADSYLNNSVSIVANTVNITSLPGRGADSRIHVTANGKLTINANSSLNSIKAYAGSEITRNIGFSFTGNLELRSDENSTATFRDLNETGTVSTATIQQHLSSGRNWYFASPVSNATSNVIKGTSGNQLWQRNVAGNAWTEITATDAALTPGRGYIAKVAETGTITFSGALNNGQVQYLIESYGVTSGKFHLVGNPYPSYLNWQSAVSQNPGILPTMWFRTRTVEQALGNPPVPTVSWTFSTVQYDAVEDELDIINGSANTTITGFIPPMQAFWVRIKDNVESTSFTVNNQMRDHADVANNKFKAPRSTATKRLRLEVSNGTITDETLLKFSPGASNNFDEYDSPKMFNNNAAIPEIYTRAGNERLVINGLNSYNYNTMIPLGFVAGQSGSFSIRASQLQNFDNDTQVYLLDKTSNMQFNLSEGEAYSFTSDATSSEDRFAVLFKSASGTSSVEDGAAAGMYLTAQNGKLTLQMHTALDNARVTVYSASGQNVHSQDIVSPSTVLSKTLEAGVYVVKVVNGGRSMVLRTIVY